MPLPDNLERLKHIPIDTLGLSDSTSALLKWNGITHVLDCIAFFHYSAQGGGVPWLWPRFITLLFDEVRPKLIAAGDWVLVLDAEVWHALDKNRLDIHSRRLERRVARWQGRDQNLYDIPFEQLGLSDLPPEFRRSFKSIGACIDDFLYLFYDNPQYWLEIVKAYDRTANGSLYFYEYVFEMVQPRLVELGYWRFVEEHIDDYIEQNRVDKDAL